jgi:hypothetical protein
MKLLGWLKEELLIDLGEEEKNNSGLYYVLSSHPPILSRKSMGKKRPTS